LFVHCHCAVDVSLILPSHWSVCGSIVILSLEHSHSSILFAQFNPILTKMFYIQYLTSFCQRRSWAEPIFETSYSRQGWVCRVRVNNREYTSDTAYPVENVAREKAAESAYNICYNFSVNDGMMPGQRVGQAGVKQGLPVAIGTGRRSKGSRSSRGHSSSSSYASNVYGSEYVGADAYGINLSRESSPRTSDSEVEHLPHGSRRSSSSSSSDSSGMPPICYCRRGFVVKFSRCSYCLSGC